MRSPVLALEVLIVATPACLIVFLGIFEENRRRWGIRRRTTPFQIKTLRACSACVGYRRIGRTCLGCFVLQVGGVKGLGGIGLGEQSISVIPKACQRFGSTQGSSVWGGVFVVLADAVTLCPVDCSTLQAGWLWGKQEIASFTTVLVQGESMVTCTQGSAGQDQRFWGESNASRGVCQCGNRTHVHA